MAATDNIDKIIATLRQPGFEGFKEKVYIPMGWYVTEGNKRVVLGELEKEFAAANKTEKPKPAKVKWPGMEAACTMDPLRAWKPIGKSGFTVGAGFDIAQHNAFDLNKFSFSKSLLDKVLPFSNGYAGEAPKTSVAFTKEELDELDKKVISAKLSALASKFDEKATSKKWESLTAEQQTVIYSMYHHMQSGLYRQKVWDLATGDDWEGVAKELDEAKGEFTNRRRNEALLLKGIK